MEISNREVWGIRQSGNCGGWGGVNWGVFGSIGLSSGYVVDRFLMNLDFMMESGVGETLVRWGG